MLYSEFMKVMMVCRQVFRINPHAFRKLIIPVLAFLPLNHMLTAQTGEYRYPDPPDPYQKNAGADLLFPVQKSNDSRSTGGLKILHDSTYTFCPVTPDWLTCGKEINIYDEAGNRIGNLKQGWDFGKKEWMNLERSDFSYDQSGNVLEWLFPFWDSNSNTWLNSFKRIYSTENNPKRNIQVNQYWDFGKSNWSNNEQFIAVYDARDSVAEWNYQLWYPGLNTWGNYQRYTKAYDDRGNLVERLYESWNSEKSEWENTFISRYSYDSAGKPTELVNQSWFLAAKTWLNVDKYLYTYNENRQKTEQIYQIWRFNNWEARDRYTYIYGRGNLLQFYLQYWDALLSQWSYKLSGSFVYDDNNNRTEDQIKAWEEIHSVWMDSLKRTYIYDDEGNMTEHLDQNWDSAANDWTLGNRVLLYYSRHVVTSVEKDIPVQNRVVFYPNPVTQNGTFAYPPGRSVIIEIYDEAGILRFSREDRDLNGKTEIDLHDLARGNYVFRLTSPDGIKHSGKFLKE
jgi:hypothetical protein